MASPAQIAANQLNAQHSTGPRTEEGKSAVRNNASTHGLCSYLYTVVGELDSMAAALLSDFTAEYQPQGVTEEILVFKMAEQFWLSHRASLFLSHADIKNQISDDTKQVALYLRYYTAADRAFNRSLTELRKLQKERKQQHEADPQIGFVSQNAKPAPAPLKTPAQTTPQNAKKPAAPAPVQPVPVAFDIQAINKAVAECFEPLRQAA